MYQKNTAGQALGFCLIDPTTGEGVAGASVTVVRSIDGGADAAATGAVSSLGGGHYVIDLTAADTNGNKISFFFSAPGTVPMEKTILPFDGNLVTGTGAAGQLTLWAGAQVVAGDANLIWDPTLAGLETTGPASGYALNAISNNGNSGASMGFDDGAGNGFAVGAENFGGATFQVFLCNTSPGAGPSCAAFLEGGAQTLTLCDGTNMIAYTPVVPGDWAGAAPTDLVVAVDRCAAALHALGHDP